RPRLPRHLPSLPTRRSSDLQEAASPLPPSSRRDVGRPALRGDGRALPARRVAVAEPHVRLRGVAELHVRRGALPSGRPSGGCVEDRKSTRLNSSHVSISYAV